MWKSRRKKAELAARMERPIGEGPIGVWVEYADGVRYENVPTIYDHRDPETGIDGYTILWPRDVDEDRPTAMGMERFPGLTAVSLPVPKGFTPRVGKYESKGPSD